MTFIFQVVEQRYNLCLARAIKGDKKSEMINSFFSVPGRPSEIRRSLEIRLAKKGDDLLSVKRTGKSEEQIRLPAGFANAENCGHSGNSLTCAVAK